MSKQTKTPAEQLDAAVDETAIEDLMRATGARAEPPPEIAAAIRSAVHAEWRDLISQRARRKRNYVFAAAAGVLTAVIALSAAIKLTSSPDRAGEPVLVASVVRLQGLMQVGEGGRWRDVKAGETLMSGDVLRTGHAAHAALNYNTLSVRIDEDSLLTVAAADRIALRRGRVYVDAPGERDVPLVLQTEVGDFTHRGTQYQVQVDDRRAVLSVREGVVEMMQDDRRHEISAGEQLSVANGELTRTAISPSDESWLWVLQAAPSFDIENQSLARFLEWVARETGKTVRYATPEVRKQAEGMLLRGSVSALNPEQALRAVLATTGFPFRETTTEIELRIPAAR